MTKNIRSLKRINNEKMPQGLLESKNIFCVESLEEIKRKKKFYESTNVDKNCIFHYRNLK